MREHIKAGTLRFIAVGRGLNLSEAVGLSGLHRADIDWGGPVAVDARPSRSMRSSVTIRGKGGKVATIPLATDVRDMLWDLCASHGHDRVFVNATGEPMTVPGLVSSFRRACSKAGISGFRFHDLRHTARDADRAPLGQSQDRAEAASARGYHDDSALRAHSR